MLDPRFIRENPDKVREVLKKRFIAISLLDEFLKADGEWKKQKKKSDDLRKERNDINLEIAKLKKQGKNKEASRFIEMGKRIGQELSEIEAKLPSLEEQVNKLAYDFPNLLLDDVPIGDASKNKVLKEIKPKKFSFKAKGQEELGKALGIVDIEKASEVSGARFFYLKNEGAILNMALQRFALDLLLKKGYKPIITPFMLRRKPYEGAVSFDAFKDAIYKIENEDLYLIATSEHSIAAYHMQDTLDEKDLPLKYIGISPCFRKEAGAHGRDTKGIFRLHQFYKIEQFVFCKPQDSQKLHEELIKNSEEIIKALEIPYRLVILASGDIGRVSAKTIDIEGWFPAQGSYRELISGSNCLDFQARRLGIKYYKAGDRIFVHTLNCTALAIERAIACLLENHQQQDGSVKIPKALWPYTGFKEIKGKAHNL